MNSDQMMEVLTPLLKNDIIVFTSTQPILSMSSIRHAMEISSGMVLPHIYRDESTTDIRSTLTTKTSLHLVSLDDLLNTANKCIDSCVFKDTNVDGFLVELQGSQEEDQLVLSLLHHSDLKTVTYIAFEEPDAKAIKPTKQGHFSSLVVDSSADVRRLQTSNASSNSSVTIESTYLYKPEGAEYSIYYANTFLYITPDIFTGLLTGIFMVVTALCGISCLGQIQGPATFTTKSPPIGKEG